MEMKHKKGQFLLKAAFGVSVVAVVIRRGSKNVRVQGGPLPTFEPPIAPSVTGCRLQRSHPSMLQPWR